MRELVGEPRGVGVEDMVGKRRTQHPRVDDPEVVVRHDVGLEVVLVLHVVPQGLKLAVPWLRSGADPEQTSKTSLEFGETIDVLQLEGGREAGDPLPKQHKFQSSLKEVYKLFIEIKDV